MEEVLKYFSINIKSKIKEFASKTNEQIEEIRLRSNRPISIKFSDKIKIINDYIVTTKDIQETFEKICENSVYSYKNQICEGFITIKGGHRVGIAGSCVIENGQVINVNYISSLNFRIAREVLGCSNEILKYIIDFKNNTIFNTLIVSSPGAGKTTIIRDIIRNISNGIPYVIQAKMSGVVDERGEISAMYKGIPQNDIGPLTDIVENVSKSQGMKMLIRSMSPEVIFCDEIGKNEDIEAINYAVCSGVKGVFTAHGSSLNEINANKSLKKLLQEFIISRIIFLDEKSKGKIKRVYFLDIERKEYCEMQL